MSILSIYWADFHSSYLFELSLHFTHSLKKKK